MSCWLPKDYFLALLTGLSMICASALASAQQDSVPDEPTLIMRITPPEPYLQEQITQVIKVIAPHPFEELVLDLAPIQGAEVFTLQKPKNRKFETYGGAGYIYETSRAIFPKQSGDLVIPAVRISGSVGVSRKEKMPFTLRADARTLEVRPPPAAFSEDWWLVASEVKIDESWSEPIDMLRVGDRLRRSIVVTVTGATAAHLPDLEQGRAAGLTVLPSRTERSTKVTKDGVIGSLRRSFDIRVDTDQPVNISPVRVVWWDTQSESKRRSTAPAVRLEPLPRDVGALISEVMAKAAEARTASQRGILMIMIAAGATITAGIFWLFRTRRKMRPEDRILMRSLSVDNNAINTLRALSTWAATAFPNEPPLTLEQVGQSLGPEAEQHVVRLQEAAFGPSSDQADVTNLALAILHEAQTKRREGQKAVFSALSEQLFGPKTQLPKIS